MPERRLYDVPQTAALLGVCPWTVRQLMKRREIDVTPIGRRKLISPEAIEKYIRRVTQPARTPVKLVEEVATRKTMPSEPGKVNRLIDISGAIAANTKKAHQS